MAKVIIFIIKALMFIIILGILGFLFYKNFQPTGAVVFDVQKENSLELTPIDRIIDNNGIKELASGLVYFNSQVPDRTNEVEVKVWFKDRFPENSIFTLGAKNNKSWSYKYMPLYKTKYNKKTYTSDNLPQFELGSSVYNPDKIDLSKESKLNDYENLPDVNVKNSLRGQHSMYVYLHGNLDFKLKKRDLNWYNDKDEIKAKLYMGDELLNAIVIEDDGVLTGSKNFSKLQEGELYSEEELSDGVYKIEIDNSGDSLITEIESNIKKMVLPSVFLADNKVYGLNEKNITLYAYLSDGKLNLRTYHREGLQKIKIDAKEFNFYTEDKTITIDLEKGFHEIFLEKGDIILSGNLGSYFAFSKDSYFHPYLFYETNDPKKADYIISDEIEDNNVTIDNDWIIAKAKFNLSELYINEKRELSFVFNTPHLNKNETKNYTIPIEKIEVKYVQEPLIG